MQHDAEQDGEERRDASIITTLGLIEGEVLTYLERHGATTLRQLVRELEWPAPMLMMGVGALVREGLIRGMRRELEVILEPERAWTPAGIVPPATPETSGGRRRGNRWTVDACG